MKKYEEEAKELLERIDIVGLAEGYMDDEIREAIHAKLAPCDDLTFLTAYLEAHFEKYGQMLEI